MSRVIAIELEQFPLYVKKDVPVTLNYRLITDGTAPTSGERIRFGFYGLSTFLHASTPSSGADVRTSGEFTSVVITQPQTQAWTTERTLTVLPHVTPEPSKMIQLCSIQYDPSPEYCSVFARADTRLVAPITGTSSFRAKWFDSVSESWIYSYDIVLLAMQDVISKWRLSFCQLPLGTKIHTELWADIKHDGSEGIVELATPEGDKYRLEPGKPLVISIQLRYPRTVNPAPELEMLNHLLAYQR